MGDFEFKVPSHGSSNGISSKRVKLDQNVLEQEEDGFKELNKHSIAQIVKKIENQISINLKERNKFENEPLKYMESEADLEEGCKELTKLSQV
jgi:hypothetical protein